MRSKRRARLRNTPKPRIKRSLKDQTPPNKKSVFSIIRLWLQPLSTLGLLALAIWGAFFSNFSKSIEAGLRIENNQLKQEESQLRKEISASIEQQNNVLHSIKEAEGKLLALREELITAQQQIDQKSTIVAQQNKTIATLKFKISGASESLVTIYKEKLKEDSPAFWGEKTLPRHLIQRLNNARVGSFAPQLDIMATDAYDEMVEWMDKKQLQSKNNEELLAIKQIRMHFDKKCGDKTTWLSKITSVKLPEKEKEYDSKPANFASNLVDKSIRECFK